MFLYIQNSQMMKRTTNELVSYKIRASHDTNITKQQQQQQQKKNNGNDNGIEVDDDILQNY